MGRGRGQESLSLKLERRQIGGSVEVTQLDLVSLMAAYRELWKENAKILAAELCDASVRRGLSTPEQWHRIKAALERYVLVLTSETAATELLETATRNCFTISNKSAIEQSIEKHIGQPEFRRLLLKNAEAEVDYLGIKHHIQSKPLGQSVSSVPLPPQHDDEGSPQDPDSGDISGHLVSAATQSGPLTKELKPARSKGPAEVFLESPAGRDTLRDGERCNTIQKQIRKIWNLARGHQHTVSEIRQKHPDLEVWKLVDSLPEEERTIFDRPNQWGPPGGYAMGLLAKSYGCSESTIKKWIIKFRRATPTERVKRANPMKGLKRKSD